MSKLHLTFESDLRDFVSGKTPGPDLTNFFPYQRAWLKETAKKIEPKLRQLYDRWNVSPASILFIVRHAQDYFDGEVSHHLMRDYETATRHLPSMSGKFESYRYERNTALIELSKRFYGARQRRVRDKDLTAIDDCLQIVNIWRWAAPGIKFAMKLDVDFDLLHKELHSLRWAVERSPGRGAHRPRSDLKLCARSLAIFFKHVTGYPLNESVGEILNGVFPKKWLKPNSNQKDAARGLIGKIPSHHNLAAAEAIAMQEGDIERRSFWAKQLGELRNARAMHRGKPRR